MIKYKCHKIVEAFKIEKIKRFEDTAGSNTDLVSSGGNTVSRQDVAWMKKHNPEIGGYFVRDDNKYEYYLSAGEFESGHSIFSGFAEITVVQLLEIEKAELDEKIEHLSAALARKPLYLTESEVETLENQEHVMIEYSKILRERIESFSELARLPEDIAADGPAPEAQRYGPETRIQSAPDGDSAALK